MKHRSAKTGHFVTKEFAEANPDTTITEAGFDLGKALKAISERITDEDREKQQEFQDQMKAGLGSRLDPNSPEQRVLRAQRYEETLLRQIAMLAQADESEAKQNRLYQFLTRLAEVLAEQGRYREAVEVCPNAVKKAEYKLILDAVEKDDNEICNCPAESLRDEKGTFTQESSTPILSIVSEKHGTAMLKICRVCGFAQAK